MWFGGKERNFLYFEPKFAEFLEFVPCWFPLSKVSCPAFDFSLVLLFLQLEMGS